ncbi:hypothetical protein PG984_016257 [Apiospora sp. TS-2023a]
MTPSTFESALFESPFNTPVLADATFCPFRRLPIELRTLIWSLSLQRQRFIPVYLVRNSRTKSNERDYVIKTQRRYRHSKLLRVNQEARRVALGFFTLRIPCSNLGGVPIRLSPDYDVLHIARSPWGNIVEFLPRLATEWDSRGHGVLHLALDGDLMSILGNNMGEPAREDLAMAIARLQSLWIVNLEAPDRFDRIPGPDPRPIETDLGQVASYDDLGLQVRQWRNLEATLQIRHPESNPLELRVLLADMGKTVIPSTREHVFVADRETALRRLEKETEDWERLRQVYWGQFPPWGEYLSGREEWEELRGRLQDAVGFWLFKPEAFEDPPGSVGSGLKRARDLRQHPPELCVFELGPQ